jgi:hypothetical protein
VPPCFPAFEGDEEDEEELGVVLELGLVPGLERRYNPPMTIPANTQTAITIRAISPRALECFLLVDSASVSEIQKLIPEVFRYSGIYSQEKNAFLWPTSLSKSSATIGQSRKTQSNSPFRFYGSLENTQTIRATGETTID